ncbi:MAG: efflux RND transporter periplasmic adaptor subunit [Planctomycetaceae bacterium]
MSTGSPSPQADSLSKLRIRRDQPPRGPSLFGRLLRFLLLTSVLASIAGGVWFFAFSGGVFPDAAKLMESVRPKPEVRVAIVSVETGLSADATVVATGYIESRQQARIGARATGRIQDVNVEEGSKVAANDVLAVLEHADLDASLAATEAAAARCRSELQEQDVTIQRSRRDFERAEKAFAAKTMTAAEFDAAKFDCDAAVARRVSLEAALSLAEARIQEARQLRENMFVRAPFAGTVISKDAELGESIMPGGMGEASGRGSVVTIADLEHLEVDCDVKEDFISRVTAGQMAEISVDAVPDRRYRGTVRKVIPMGDRARATVKVRVAFQDADQKLFPEMSATVYFLPEGQTQPVEQPAPRIFCPNDALHSANDQTWVWIVNRDDRLQKTTVQIAERREDRTEIASGLTGGEKVVVSKPQDFRDGLAVKPAQ